MTTVKVNGTELYFEDTGGDGAPVVFSHGLLWDTRLFAPQVEALKSTHRCIAYDHRGQGRSADASERAIDLDTLADDGVALIETLRLAPCHFVGLSMGGFVGMRIAARRPELVKSLVLLDTSADPEPPENVRRYRMLNTVARWTGLWPVTGRVMPILFGQTFLRDPARAAEHHALKRRLRENKRSIWRAVNGVIEREGVGDELPRIQCPTLVIVGEEDVATVPREG